MDTILKIEKLESIERLMCETENKLLELGMVAEQRRLSCLRNAVVEEQIYLFETEEGLGASCL